MVVFDPERVRDLATYEQPLQRSEGIERVYLNGQLALTARDRSCRQRAGRVLERAVGGGSVHASSAP